MYYDTFNIKLTDLQVLLSKPGIIGCDIYCVHVVDRKVKTGSVLGQ